MVPSAFLVESTTNVPPRRPQRRGSHGEGGVHREENPRENRTVNDFESPQSLIQALSSPNVVGSYHSPVQTGCEVSTGTCNLKIKLEQHEEKLSSFDSEEIQDMKRLDEKLDWVLENCDDETTVPQTMKDELRRLIALKSYMVLDVERQGRFEDITRQAGEHFQCPIALISLVDLGRQWFLSNRGLPVRETSRKLAFCAHAIQSTKDCFVVDDATRDPRFCNSPLVTGPPDIRFYAGAPLITKEGCNIGTLCVIDTVARPGGIVDSDQQFLIQMAAKVIEAFEDHRKIQSVWYQNLKTIRYPSLEDVADDATASPDVLFDDLDCRDDNEALVGGVDEKLLDKVIHLAAIGSGSEAATILHHTKLEKKKKKVRFDVHENVHHVESFREWKDQLWWSSKDTYHFRLRADRVAKAYREMKPQCVKCIKVIAKNDEVDLKQLVIDFSNRYTHARGLEDHIVTSPTSKRRSVVKAVLRAQLECQLEEDDEESTSWYLRQESLSYSHASKRFAERLGQLDQLSVLTSSSSRWGFWVQAPTPGCLSAPVLPIRSQTPRDPPSMPVRPALCRWNSGCDNTTKRSRGRPALCRWNSGCDNTTKRSRGRRRQSAG